MSYNLHKQPADAKRTIDKVMELPRRTAPGAGEGFDALGIVGVELANDGSPARLVTYPPAPKLGDIYEYSQMIHRVVGDYAFRFKSL